MATSKEKTIIGKITIKKCKKKETLPTILLAGKWRYKESYDGGHTEGELTLNQTGKKLSGKLIFNDYVGNQEPSLMQELVVGVLEGRKVSLDAYEYDIIETPNRDFNYELDSWFGIAVDNTTIQGISLDQQSVGGDFILEKID